MPVHFFMYAWCMHENKLVRTLSPLQLEITIPVGKEGDVCIHTDQLGYGVLSVSTSKQIICTTCCFNKTSCQHVQHIKTFFDTNIDPSPILQLMQMEVQSDSSNTQRSSYRTLKWYNCLNFSQHIALVFLFWFIIWWILIILQCPSEYRELLSSLASSSPVCCGLVLPSETNFRLLQKMKEDYLTKDVNKMLALQNEIPIGWNCIKLYRLFHIICWIPS